MIKSLSYFGDDGDDDNDDYDEGIIEYSSIN